MAFVLIPTNYPMILEARLMSKRLLICTDLDRTLLPNGSQPESSGARELFRRVTSDPSVSLAYVSGRHQQLVLDAIREYAIPWPDWVIADVGSTIYRVIKVIGSIGLLGRENRSRLEWCPVKGYPAPIG